MTRVVYNNKNASFFPSLKKEVDNYFKSSGKSRLGNWHLYTKTIVLIPSAIALYFVLLNVAMPAWSGIVLSGLLGFILASIGFNVMHDANHGAYSGNPKLNNILGLTLNMLGGNAFIWKQKHNIIHHTYTNVDGLDDDIAKHPFIRMCSTQQWRPAHRIQFLYISVLYAVSSIFWVLYQDFDKYFKHKVYHTKLSSMSAKEHIIFWLSKVFYLVVYIIIPILVVGWKAWLTGFLSMHVMLGLTLAIVFQLAHVVEETSFEFVAEHDSITIENEWAIHQVKTTANFSPGNKVLSWFVGGLNYQIEHHLFPKISHVHYPALSRIVQAKCREHGIDYYSMPSFAAAVASHYRFIYQLGKKPSLCSAELLLEETKMVG